MVEVNSPSFARRVSLGEVWSLAGLSQENRRFSISDVRDTAEVHEDIFDDLLNLSLSDLPLGQGPRGDPLSSLRFLFEPRGSPFRCARKGGSVA